MKLVNGLIYKITNKINKKIYIGQTIRSLKARWKRHTRGTSRCTSLSNAIKKYGAENFTIEVIDKATTPDELNKKEIYWIAYYKSDEKEFGYNIQIGGRNGNKDHYKLSEKDELEIERLDADGISHIKIGEIFGINRKTVTFILKRRIPYINKRVRIESRNDLDRIKEFLETENPTLKECRDKFKISNGSIYRIARAIGHQFPTFNQRLAMQEYNCSKSVQHPQG